MRRVTRASAAERAPRGLWSSATTSMRSRHSSPIAISTTPRPSSCPPASSCTWTGSSVIPRPLRSSHTRAGTRSLRGSTSSRTGRTPSWRRISTSSMIAPSSWATRMSSGSRFAAFRTPSSATTSTTSTKSGSSATWKKSSKRPRPSSARSPTRIMRSWPSAREGAASSTPTRRRSASRPPRRWPTPPPTGGGSNSWPTNSSTSTTSSESGRSRSGRSITTARTTRPCFGSLRVSPPIMRA